MCVCVPLSANTLETIANSGVASSIGRFLNVLWRLRAHAYVVAIKVAVSQSPNHKGYTIRTISMKSKKAIVM